MIGALQIQGLVFSVLAVLLIPDCLYALQATIPHLTRSSLHRCLQRHGISRLPEIDGDKPGKRKFKTYALGFFHIDIGPREGGGSDGGRQAVPLRRDRPGDKVRLRPAPTRGRRRRRRRLASRALVKAVPYRIHTILTDNGIHFNDPRSRGSAVDEIKRAMAAASIIALVGRVGEGGTKRRMRGRSILGVRRWRKNG